MEKVSSKLDNFLDKYSKRIDSDLVEFVRGHMDDYLNGNNQIDLLAQIAYAIGEKPANGSVYEEYFDFLHSNYNLDSDILEIGCGFYPAFAEMIDKYQREKKTGTIEAYDPNLVLTRKGNIRLHRGLFKTIKDRKYNLITSIFPCDATIRIIDEAEKNDCDFSILMCECVPEAEIYSMYPYQSTEMWLNNVYKYAKRNARNREIGIEYIKQIDPPIIFSKRKK